MIRDCYRSHEVAVRLRSFYERSRAGRETLQNETARTLLTKYAGGLVSFRRRSADFKRSRAADLKRAARQFVGWRH